MNAAQEVILTNGAAGLEPRTTPRVSVLVPFFRDDPSALIRTLAASKIGEDMIELIALDDGNGRADLCADVLSAMGEAPFPCRLIIRKENLGRAGGRNRLIAEARGQYVLFIDADMALCDDFFFARWMDLIARENPAVAFGGFEVRSDTADRETALHAHISRQAECLPAEKRAAKPAQYLATSNLLVRRDVLNAFAFDAGFRGWGYEDSEWAFRVAQRHAIRHIDNPLVHCGLDRVEQLIEKYAACGPNYIRLARAHPAAAEGFAALRLANAIRAVPQGPHWVGAFAAWLARDPARILPLSLRGIGLKSLRAAAIAAAAPANVATQALTVERAA